MVLLGKVALGFTGVMVTGLGLLFSEGIVEVKVVEKQPEVHHIFVVAPAILAPVGMHFVPRHHLREAAEQIRPHLPEIRAALESLREAEDMTFVDVKDHDQHVQVKKDGGSIVVNVTDQDENVYVSVPIRAISSTVEELAAASPATQP